MFNQGQWMDRASVHSSSHLILIYYIISLFIHHLIIHTYKYIGTSHLILRKLDDHIYIYNSKYIIHHHLKSDVRSIAMCDHQTLMFS